MDFDRMLRYCAELDRNNTRTWFHENHKQYEKAREDYLRLIDMLRYAIADEAPALADDILFSQPKDWMYRIARDMRYSHNLPPYNPAFRAYISADRKSFLPIGYFLRIAPGSSCFGTGLWCETSESLNRARSYFAENYGKIEEICAETGLAVTGDRLKRVPRGYDEDHPAAWWLKFKEWSVITDIRDEELTTFEEADTLIRGLVRRMEPVRQFLFDAARTEPTRTQAFGAFYEI